jgi:hypothetical protein
MKVNVDLGGGEQKDSKGSAMSTERCQRVMNVFAPAAAAVETPCIVAPGDNGPSWDYQRTLLVL